MIVRALRTLLLAQPPIAHLYGGQRIYPRQLPDAPTFDAMTITKVYGRGEQDLAGGTELEEARVQLDHFTVDGYEAMEEAVSLVRRFLHGYTGPALSPCGIQRAACINSVDMTESLTERAGPRLRRHMLEFTVWHTEV